jgi:hypothetical protein
MQIEHAVLTYIGYDGRLHLLVKYAKDRKKYVRTFIPGIQIDVEAAQSLLQAAGNLL